METCGPFMEKLERFFPPATHRRRDSASVGSSNPPASRPIGSIDIFNRGCDARHGTLLAESSHPKARHYAQPTLRGDTCPTNCAISWRSHTLNWKNST